MPKSRSTAKDSTVSITDEKTDYSRWRLRADYGRHTWHYLKSEEEIKKWPQSIAEKYHLGLATVSLCPLLCVLLNTNDLYSEIKGSS